MVCYFDTSFLLSALFGERPGSDHAPWDLAAERLSSELLRLECWTAIRRAAALQPPDTPERWAEDQMTRLDSYFERVTFKAVDSSIETIVRHEPRLSGCRTLDAIHVATALYFSPHLDEDLVICTFDSRMKATAEAVRMRVHWTDPPVP